LLCLSVKEQQMGKNNENSNDDDDVRWVKMSYDELRWVKMS
jgi:hypothetical protein